MKTILNITVVVIALSILVPEADAIFGVRRRTAYRTAVVVGSTLSSEAKGATAP